VYVRKWRVAESRLSAVDDGPERVGRQQIDIGSDRRQRKQRKTTETAEDNGSGGSVWMLSEDDGRWRFNILQSRFRRVGGGHAYHRLSKQSMILGFTWLDKHNLEIDFRTRSVKMTRCLLRCCVGCQADRKVDWNAKREDTERINTCRVEYGDISRDITSSRDVA